MSSAAPKASKCNFPQGSYWDPLLLVFFWLTSLMCPLPLDDHKGTCFSFLFFSFFPRAQTQHQIAKELRENDVRVVQRVMRYQNTLDGQHQSHLCTCATRREDSSNARENQKLLSTHTRTHTRTHTHTYCKVQLNAQFIRQTEPKNPEVKPRRREKEVG